MSSVKSDEIPVPGAVIAGTTTLRNGWSAMIALRPFLEVVVQFSLRRHTDCTRARQRHDLYSSKLIVPEAETFRLNHPYR